MGESIGIDLIRTVVGGLVVPGVTAVVLTVWLTSTMESYRMELGRSAALLDNVGDRWTDAFKGSVALGLLLGFLFAWYGMGDSPWKSGLAAALGGTMFLHIYYRLNDYLTYRGDRPASEPDRREALRLEIEGVRWVNYLVYVYLALAFGLTASEYLFIRTA